MIQTKLRLVRLSQWMRSSCPITPTRTPRLIAAGASRRCSALRLLAHLLNDLAQVWPPCAPLENSRKNATFPVHTCSSSATPECASLHSVASSLRPSFAQFHFRSAQAIKSPTFPLTPPTPPVGMIAPRPPGVPHIRPGPALHREGGLAMKRSLVPSRTTVTMIVLAAFVVRCLTPGDAD